MPSIVHAAGHELVIRWPSADLEGQLAADADVWGAAELAPGGKHCVSQYANYRVRADGTATNQGAFFTIESAGQVRADAER
jgi:hypothetical protein